MPYKSIDNLPRSVRNVLPKHAQHIFRDAFNASFSKYGEIRAFKISWAAVKKKYKKQGDKWVIRATAKPVKKKTTKRKTSKRVKTKRK